MHVAELWRYPVKSLAGERLDGADVLLDGICGDRLVHVRRDGRVVTARARPGLLSLRGTLDGDGEPRVDGHRWDSAEALALVRPHVAGRHAGLFAEPELVRDDSFERFDVLPLSVATDGAVAALGIDPRRLRPNLVVGGVDGLDERRWPGRMLAIGSVRLAIARLRPRCFMTTWDPDTQEQDPSVLRRIVQQFGGKVALNAEVVTPGWLTVGDPVLVY